MEGSTTVVSTMASAFGQMATDISNGLIAVLPVVLPILATLILVAVIIRVVQRITGRRA